MRRFRFTARIEASDGGGAYVSHSMLRTHSGTQGVEGGVKRQQQIPPVRVRDLGHLIGGDLAALRNDKQWAGRIAF